MAPEPSGLLYFEDLAEGQAFRSAPRLVGTAEIKEFAGRYDPQPFHLDEERAAGTLFGGLAASGWHTAAITMALCVGCCPLAGGIIGLGGEELRWPAPVRPGDRLHVEIELIALRESRSRPKDGLVKLRIRTVKQDGVEVQVFTPTLIVPRRNAA